MGIIQHVRFKKVRQSGCHQKIQNLLLVFLSFSFKNTTAMKRSDCPGGVPEQISLDSEEQAQKDRTFASYLNRSSKTSLKANASKHLFDAIFQNSTSPESLDNSSATAFSLRAFNEIAQLTAPEMSQQDLPSKPAAGMKNSPKSLFQNFPSKKGHRVKIPVSNKQFFSQYCPIKIVHRSGLRQLFIIQSIRESKKKIMKMTYKVRFEGTNQILGQTEIQNLSVLEHPSLPRLTQVFEDCNKYMLVFDYIEGVTLTEFIDQYDVTEQIGRTILCQLLEALDYLHGCSFVHGKVTPDNIYVSNYEKNALDIKIHFIDLATAGPSRHFGTEKQLNATINDPYASPESANGVFTTKSDIWSVGILTMVIFAKIKNFSENSWLFFDSLIEKSQVYSSHIKNIPDNVVSFINYMLLSKPIHRPSAAQALKHKWLGKGEVKSSSGHRRVRQQPFISLK